jgi:hypothetical protein
MIAIEIIRLESIRFPLLDLDASRHRYPLDVLSLDY